MKRLLFVCVENSCRSQIAEAFARIHGAGEVEVYSAGSRPSGKVNPKAIESMRELDYDLTKHDSKSLEEIPNVEYDFVATMGCGDECRLCEPSGAKTGRFQTRKICRLSSFEKHAT